MMECLKRIKNGVNIIVIVMSLLLAVSSCIKDEQDEEQFVPPIDEPPVSADSATIAIDSTFQISMQDLYGEWQTEYDGFDPQQSFYQGKDVVSRIRKDFKFTDDGFYESHVQGIANIADTTITEFIEFEHEYGRFSYDEQRQVMKYFVEYDSLINFRTDSLEFHAGKVRGQNELSEYDERIWFSVEQEGKRGWIRIDDNLLPVDNHATSLYYIMKKRK